MSMVVVRVRKAILVASFVERVRLTSFATSELYAPCDRLILIKRLVLVISRKAQVASVQRSTMVGRCYVQLIRELSGRSLAELG